MPSGLWTKRSVMASYGLTDRQCRLGRKASHGRIIACALGYKLIRHATADEIREAYMSILRQIKSEQNEVAVIMHRAHESLNRDGVA